MTVGYAITFEQPDLVPLTYQGTLTEDQSLALVALLLDPALLVDGGDGVSETSETSSGSQASGHPPSEAAVDPALSTSHETFTAREEISDTSASAERCV